MTFERAKDLMTVPFYWNGLLIPVEICSVCVEQRCIAIVPDDRTFFRKISWQIEQLRRVREGEPDGDEDE